MSEFECPECGSDDVRGERQAGGKITLTCQSCGVSWARVPKASCPRCGRGDVEEYGQEDSAEDEAVGGRTFRCRKCHNTWGEARQHP
jgi:transposase-like protein